MRNFESRDDHPEGVNFLFALRGSSEDNFFICTGDETIKLAAKNGQDILLEIEDRGFRGGLQCDSSILDLVEISGVEVSEMSNHCAQQMLLEIYSDLCPELTPMLTVDSLLFDLVVASCEMASSQFGAGKLQDRDARVLVEGNAPVCPFNCVADHYIQPDDGFDVLINEERSGLIFTIGVRFLQGPPATLAAIERHFGHPLLPVPHFLENGEEEIISDLIVLIALMSMKLVSGLKRDGAGPITMSAQVGRFELYGLSEMVTLSAETLAKERR